MLLLLMYLTPYTPQTQKILHMNIVKRLNNLKTIICQNYDENEATVFISKQF